MNVRFSSPLTHRRGKRGKGRDIHLWSQRTKVGNWLPILEWCVLTRLSQTCLFFPPVTVLKVQVTPVLCLEVGETGQRDVTHSSLASLGTGFCVEVSPSMLTEGPLLTHLAPASRLARLHSAFLLFWTPTLRVDSIICLNPEVAGPSFFTLRIVFLFIHLLSFFCFFLNLPSFFHAMGWVAGAWSSLKKNFRIKTWKVFLRLSSFQISKQMRTKVFKENSSADREPFMHFDFLQEAKGPVRTGRSKGVLGKREVSQGGNKSHISNFLEFSSLTASACLILRINFLYRYVYQSHFQKEGFFFKEGINSSLSNLKTFTWGLKMSKLDAWGHLRWNFNCYWKWLSVDRTESVRWVLPSPPFLLIFINSP